MNRAPATVTIPDYLAAAGAVNGVRPGPVRRRAGFRPTTQINRRYVGITIPVGGGGVVSDKVSIRFKRCSSRPST